MKREQVHEPAFAVRARLLKTENPTTAVVRAFVGKKFVNLSITLGNSHNSIKVLHPAGCTLACEFKGEEALAGFPKLGTLLLVEVLNDSETGSVVLGRWGLDTSKPPAIVRKNTFDPAITARRTGQRFFARA